MYLQQRSISEAVGIRAAEKAVLLHKELEVMPPVSLVNRVNPLWVLDILDKMLQLARRIPRQSAEWRFFPEAGEDICLASSGAAAVGQPTGIRSHDIDSGVVAVSRLAGAIGDRTRARETSPSGARREVQRSFQFVVTLAEAGSMHTEGSRRSCQESMCLGVGSEASRKGGFRRDAR